MKMYQTKVFDLKNVRSVFNMSAEANAIGAHKERNTFLNYWNLGQTFYMCGSSSLAKLN